MKGRATTVLIFCIQWKEGVEKAYFAPPEVHQEIVKLGCKGGDEIRLTKIAEENGKKGVAKILVERLKIATKPIDADRPDNFKAIMEQALKDAIEITEAAEGHRFRVEKSKSLRPQYLSHEQKKGVRVIFCVKARADSLETP